MLEEWQKKVTPTWSAMTQALMGIGRGREASELAQKHGWLNIRNRISQFLTFRVCFPLLYLGAPPPKPADSKVLEQLHVTNIPQQKEVIV